MKKLIQALNRKEVVRIINTLQFLDKPLRFRDIRKECKKAGNAMADTPIKRALDTLQEIGWIKKQEDGKRPTYTFKLKEDSKNSGYISALLERNSDIILLNSYNPADITIKPKISYYGLPIDLFYSQDNKKRPKKFNSFLESLKKSLRKRNVISLNKTVEINKNDITILLPEQLNNKNTYNKIYEIIKNYLPKLEDYKINIKSSKLECNIDYVLRHSIEELTEMKREYLKKEIKNTFIEKLKSYSGNKNAKLILNKYKDVFVDFLSFGCLHKEKSLIDNIRIGYGFETIKNTNREIYTLFGKKLSGKNRNFYKDIDKLSEEERMNVFNFLFSISEYHKELLSNPTTVVIKDTIVTRTNKEVKKTLKAKDILGEYPMRRYREINNDKK